jgi:hypothetical protein
MTFYDASIALGNRTTKAGLRVGHDMDVLKGVYSTTLSFFMAAMNSSDI